MPMQKVVNFRLKPDGADLKLACLHETFVFGMKSPPLYWCCNEPVCVLITGRPPR